ncbi:putative E3 ubiquitin-protein ligase ARI10-like protein [Cladobotryum mycophilum]|uniref:RBR-type E3 ubiquitin transferase n=1 Tax=Cladobotryum mycophilum TaxID=491253 RepID=A0ABR0T2Z8_9HYPO
MVTPEEEAFTIPELNDSDFITHVLHLPADKSEAQIDNDLVARASAVGIAATLPSVASKRHTSSALSYTTFATFQDRSFSTASNGSYSTVLTPRSSIYGLPSPIIGSELDEGRRDSKCLSFSQYERYLAALDNPDQPKFLSAPPVIDGSTQSVFSVSTRKSFSSVRTGLRSRIRWRKRPTQPLDPTLTCVTCRDDFNKAGRLHSLPCGHTHCANCLRGLLTQAITHEAKMPPRCCSQAIPASTVRTVLTQGEQESFLLAVVKYATPWEDRIFCPDVACKEFVPPQDAPDPKHPFDLACLKCHGRLCGMCREAAHPIGQDCPKDWELAAMKKLADQSSWRRCHSCRGLVELTGESPHMTCRCKVKFCSLCGGIWDPTTGCPNICSYEEELERRRQEEGDRKATDETETEKRSRANSAIEQLGDEQQKEMKRFLEYMTKASDELQARHSIQKESVTEKYEHQEEKMKERHERAITQLEDRQIAAELELRTSLDQSERSVRLRLKHMEAYCEGLGRSPNSEAPSRVVTERDLRELGQQYNLRDDMDRMHQAKINVMRDRQAKQMEELIERQENELERLSDRRQAELDKLAVQFSQEQSLISDVFESRQGRMHPRWVLAIEVLCKELEEQTGQTFSRIAPPRWPEEKSTEPGPEDTTLLAPEVTAAA